MSDNASITGNTANIYGGGVYVSSGTFKLNSGTISGNSAQYGGGVYMNGGTFTMSDSAAITGNTAKFGGGVYSQLGIFTMSGSAKISGNSATQYGGGVYKNSGSSDSTNHDVYLSDSVQVKDNWQNGTLNGGVYVKGENSSASNLCLANSDWIRIAGTLTSAASIGVTTSKTPTESVPVSFACYEKNVTPGENDAERFTSDAGHIVTTQEGGLFLKLRPHVWTYTADNTTHTITAKCSDCNMDGGSVTLQAPAEDTLTYDGRDKAAEVTASRDWQGSAVDNITIGYTKTGKYGPEALENGALPTNAGTYTAIIKLGDAEVSVEYTIKKATPTAGDFTFSGPENPIYDGTDKVARITPKSDINGMGQVVIWHYLDGGVSAVKNTGNYTVKITVEEGTNYKAATTQLTADDWTFAIQPREVTLTWDGYENRTYGDGKTVTAKAGNLVNGDEIGVTVTDGDATAIGTHTATATGLTGGKASNYTLPANKTREYTIAPAEQKLTFEHSGEQSVTYGKTLANPATNAAKDGGTVTYSSSSTDIATVDENGTVTAQKAGTATITATAAAVDGKYSETAVSYTLTVTPKTLTKDDLELTGNFTKTYDGNAAANSVGARIKSGVLVGHDTLDITGSAVYNNKDVKDANTITFTPNAITTGNYRLAADQTLTVTDGVKITPRVLTIKSVETTPKLYDGDTNAYSCITGVTFDGLVEGETLNKSGLNSSGQYVIRDYSINEAAFSDPNVGNAIQITGEVGITTQNQNYTFKDKDGKDTSRAGFTTSGSITPANGGGLGSETRQQRFTDSAEHTVTQPRALPANQTWNYNSSLYTISSATVNHRVDNATGTLTYQITGGKTGDRFIFTVTASCNNYNDFSYTVTVNLTDREQQSGFRFADSTTAVNKIYGDAAFTIAATGAATGSTVTYESSDTAVAEVDPRTGEVTIVGAGTATITATASATTDHAEATASYTLTVSKLRIAVPTAGKNELVYNGKEQTYTPDRLDAKYCEITSNTAKDVIAGGNWNKADVSLKDPNNTEWDDGKNNTEHREYRFRITPAPATVTVQDKKITAGQPAPELTSADCTITGLIGNDKLGSLKLYYADPSDLKTEVTPDTGKAGMYTIVATYGGGTRSINYAPTFINGTLTIENRSSSSGGGSTTYSVNTPSKAENGTVTVSPKSASKGSTVTITVKPDSGYQLDKLTVTDSKGNELKLTDQGNGKYTFTMPSGKVEVKTAFAKEIMTSPFRDVSTDAYYYEAVKWAAEKGITSGIDNDLFGPNQPCTRAQIVTFLWRAAGSPEPRTLSSFSDVSADSYYAKAVAWAVENGITAGTSATTFSPDATCTRAQSVTFLFRAIGKTVDNKSAFTDVSDDSYYADAVAWAAENGVTNGIGGGLFGPDNSCIRAQIVTFLYRAYQGS